MIHGGTDTGWTFYTPYSTTTVTTVAPVLLGAFILGMGSIVTGLELHRDRRHHARPGLT